MSASDWLELVQRLIVPVFFFDLLALPFALWWIRRWKLVRQR